MVDVPDHPSTGRGLWFLAAMVALTLHLGVAAFAVARMHDVDSDELGAPAIEIGLDLTSPLAPPSDLPPGPDSDASVASAAVQEQKAAIKPLDLQKEIPVEAVDPDRIVTIDKSKRPNKDRPDVKAQESRSSQEAAAQEATAAPAQQNTPDQRSVTVEQGTGESRQRVRVTWQKELISHLDKHKRYPADRNQKAAQIVLSLYLDRTGRVVSASVLKSSGDGSFDAAALSMVRRADPVPPPPPSVADEGLNFTLPVVFRVGSRR